MKPLNLTWWRSDERHHIYKRWVLLVLLNAAYPFLLSLMTMESNTQIVGVVLGIISFIIIYAELENYLLQHRYQTLSKQLRLSALLKVTTVFLPFIDLIVGSVSIEITKVITSINLQSYQTKVEAYSSSLGNLKLISAAYITTMIDGILLSLLVALILGLIRLIANLRRKYKEQQ